MSAIADQVKKTVIRDYGKKPLLLIADGAGIMPQQLRNLVFRLKASGEIDESRKYDDYLKLDPTGDKDMGLYQKEKARGYTDTSCLSENISVPFETQREINAGTKKFAPSINASGNRALHILDGVERIIIEIKIIRGE